MLGGTEMEKGLVRVLSGEEEIADLRTPKGIMITGPPGELRRFIGSSVAVGACGRNAIRARARAMLGKIPAGQAAQSQHSIPLRRRL